MIKYFVSLNFVGTTYFVIKAEIVTQGSRQLYHFSAFLNLKRMLSVELTAFDNLQNTAIKKILGNNSFTERVIEENAAINLLKTHSESV